MMRNGGERFNAWRAELSGLCLILAGCLASGSFCAAEDLNADDNAERELQERWAYSAPLQLPPDAQGTLLDLVLDVDVFTHSRADLGDLRLYDETGNTVPYALRVLQPTFRRDPYAAREFNRAAGPDGSTELTLDLQRDPPYQDPVEHNEVEIKMPGSEFRRHVVVEGSDDGTTWSKLAETDLVRFERGAQKIDGNTVSYPPSRYRQLHIRVFPDKSVAQDPVSVEEVLVVRRVDVPGEVVTHEGQLEPREPVMGDGGPGSAWIIDLQGDKVPCDRLEVEVDDNEFARNFRLEAGGPAGSRELFQPIYGGDNLWQRRVGQAKQPLSALFPEVRASRLRLVVTDFRNPPLAIRTVRFGAPAREIVFARPASPATSLRLFFGNPDAAAPNYDFARNLPTQLPAPPVRVNVGPIVPNPDFVPPPKPLTERWPWLIYVVLGAVSVVLGLVILGVARHAIARHDRTVDRTVE